MDREPKVGIGLAVAASLLSACVTSRPVEAPSVASEPVSAGQTIEAGFGKEPAVVTPAGNTELDWDRINAVMSAMGTAQSYCGTLSVGDNGLAVVARWVQPGKKFPGIEYIEEPYYFGTGRNLYEAYIDWTIILGGLDSDSELLPVVTDKATGKTYATHGRLSAGKNRAAKFIGSAWMDDTDQNNVWPIEPDHPYEVSAIDPNRPGLGVGQYSGEVLDSVLPQTPRKEC